MMRLDELTRKELFVDIDDHTKYKASKIKGITYLGVTEDYTAFFRVKSVTANPPTTYLVKIRMNDYPDVADAEDLDTREKVRLAIAGDLAISCTCPAFLYFGYKYILTQLDANAENSESRFPKVKNPKLNGIMCKHCYQAVITFPQSWMSIAKDIDNEHYLGGK